MLPRTCLLTIYKGLFISSARSLLDCDDTIYGKPNNEFFKDCLEKIQYNATLAIAGAIRGTS